MRSLAALPYFVLQWLRGAAINARRRDRTARYVLWSALAGAANAAMLILAVAFVGFLWWLSLWWLALAMTAVLVVPVVAGALIRLVLVPAGWHRLAYRVALYSRPGPDPVGFALCVAASARSRRPRCSPPGAATPPPRAPCYARCRRSSRITRPCASSPASGSRATPPSAARGTSCALRTARRGRRRRSASCSRASPRATWAPPARRRPASCGRAG